MAAEKILFYKCQGQNTEVHHFLFLSLMLDGPKTLTWSDNILSKKNSSVSFISAQFFTL